MTGNKDHTLAALGEFRAITSIIEPMLLAAGVAGSRGDDAGAVATGLGEHIVVTCDVAPKPAIWDLIDRPWESWGWYAVAASLSDLVAVGANPLGLVTSVEAPRTMAADDLAEFVSGVAAACARFNLEHLGGNLREAAEFACHSTVVGETGGFPLLSRQGCRVDDVIVVLGPCGEFAAAYLLARRYGMDRLEEAAKLRLTRPLPLVGGMGALRDRGVLINAATDNSDGLLGAVWNLAERSACRMVLEVEEWELSSRVRVAAEKLGVEPLRLALMWGDWNVVVAVSPSQYEPLKAACNDTAIESLRIGRVTAGEPGLVRLVGDDLRETRVLRNEAFAPWNYSTGRDQAIARIMDESLDYE